MQDRYVIATAVAGISASLIGMTYLTLVGAPATFVMINGIALLIGLFLMASIRFTIRISDELSSSIGIAASLLLLATALFGFSMEGASRWVIIGPFFVQTSLILLPIIIVSFARQENSRTLISIVVAALAMAIQPDRAMAGALFFAVMVVGLLRPSRYAIGGAIFCATTFTATILLPDHLHSVPFVDHILWTAFDINLLVGLSLWLGCLILICPILFVERHQRNSIHFALTTCWATIIAAAAMGAYPTPIVGYGASAIIGYFMCLILMPPVGQDEIVESGNRAPATDNKEVDMRFISPTKPLAL